MSLKSKISLSIITVLLGVFGVLLSAPATSAKGETYTYTGTGANADGLGSTTITATGGAFKGSTVFTKQTVPKADALPSDNSAGYTVFYYTNNINLKTKASSDSNCLNAPAVIAMKKVAQRTAFLYLGFSNDCGSRIGALNGDLSTLDPISADLELSEDITVQPNVVETKNNAYASALRDALKTVEDKWYAQYVVNSCASKTTNCDRSKWVEYLGTCWATARTTAASGARQGDPNYDVNQQTLSIFSGCLSGKIISLVPEATQPAILSLLVAKDIKAADINKAGDTAGTAATNAADTALTGKPGTSCGVGDLAWIVCPALSFMADLLESIFQVLSNDYLRVDLKLLAPDSGTFIAWGIFRNIANVAFVIVFLIIIFSQMTGAGVTNYGVKKMLPRLVVAAILVNVSYYVCQIAVDLSNILGFSLKSLFDSIATATNLPTSDDASANGGGIVAIVAAVIGATAVAYFSLAALIPVLIGALVAVIMIMLMLMARKAFVVILIVLAPLAFVAFLLPNTEGLFKMWRKIFSTLLLLFPIISIVFGASSLASQIILQANPKDTNNQIVSVGVMAIPFFVVPILLKGSLDSIGGLGNRLNGFASKAGGKLGGLGGKAFDYSGLGYQNSRLAQLNKYRKEERDKKRALIQSGEYTGGGLSGLRSKANKAFNQSDLSGNFGNRSAASGVQLADKMETEQVEAAETMMRSMNPSDLVAQSAADLQSAVAAGDTIKARAAQKILLGSGARGEEYLHRALRSSFQTAESKNSEVGQSLRRMISTADMKGRNNALATWSYNNDSLDETAAAGSTYAALNDDQFAAQNYSLLEAAARAGHFTQERADALFENKQVFKNLDDNKKRLVESLRTGGTGAPIPPAGPGSFDGPI